MIFGTDGLRAPFNQEPLTQQTIAQLSATIEAWAPPRARVVLGHDTRATHSAIRDWITTYWQDIEIIDLGAVPTPVVALETKERQASLGVMITASHNPASDNGLKFFDGSGLKALYDQAKAWSDDLESRKNLPRPEGQPQFVQAEPVNYQKMLLEHFKREDFSGHPVAFDFANGAASIWGPRWCDSLGIQATYLGDHPNGENINLHVGAMHPQQLATLCRNKNINAGFALDGDGDRLIVTDRFGIVPGDVTLYALKQIMAEAHGQPKEIVGTVMCGMGLEETLRAEGITLIRTPVGDQHVLAEMVAKDLLLGGEPSGHLLQGDLFLAGDGFLAALRIAQALQKNPDLLREARAAVPMYPVFEKAYPVKRKTAFEELPEMQECIQRIETRSQKDGRMIIRYSGTEAKLRVYVESRDLEPYKDDIACLETLIETHLNS
jgi:phosphoglucosamine mutase